MIGFWWSAVEFEDKGRGFLIEKCEAFDEVN